MSGLDLPKGLRATAEHVVMDADTAIAVGSGSLPVLGTPTVLRWFEAATCAAIADRLPAGSSSVGTRVALEHLAASPVGACIECAAELVHVDGRLLRFEVTAVSDARLVARGEITRVVVDEERFLNRITLS